jgi:hypothetical protein
MPCDRVDDGRGELMETVGNYPDVAAAHVAQSVLAAAGIESEIPDQYLSGVDWQMGTALHGITLRVHPEDAEEARALLEEVEIDRGISEEAGESFGAECGVCGGDGPEPPRWKRRMKALSLLFPPLILLYGVASLVLPARRCPSCGHA